MDEADDIKGLKWEIRIVQLQPWHRIRAMCNHCQHVGLIDPETLKAMRLHVLQARYKWNASDEYLRQLIDNTRLGELQEKLRCCQCDARRANSLDVVKLLRNTYRKPLHPCNFRGHCSL